MEIDKLIVVTLLSLMLILSASLASPVDAMPTDTVPSISDPALEVQVGDLVKGLDGVYGVAVKSMKNSRTIAVNADQPFETASLYKLLVAYRIYREIEEGSLAEGDTITIEQSDTIYSLPDVDLEIGHELTISDALRAMITWSSNSADLALVRISGGWPGFLASAKELGIPVEIRQEDHQFLIRPVDFIAFYERLVSGTLLRRPYSDELITLLLAQEFNDRLPALLPTGTPVAHKTGELEDIRNDAGIVFGPENAYIIVVMSNGINVNDAVRAEAAISRLVYDQYQADWPPTTVDSLPQRLNPSY